MDKTEPSKVDILGVGVSLLDERELTQVVAARARHGPRSAVLNVNVHCLNLACVRPSLRAFLNRAPIVFCDGAGVQLAARILGKPVPVRITYADWIWNLARALADTQAPLFLLGGRPGVAAMAANRLVQFAPGLIIAGVKDGYFSREGVENNHVIDVINKSGAKVLLVCFGMPLQEEWLEENMDSLAPNVFLTGGAALDYTAGVLTRGPRYLTQHGFEWMARLVIEPRRLAARYIVGNPLFLLRVVAQRMRGR